MFILILFAFIGGIITILSPCILPILPLVLSSSLTGGKKRPLGIVAGFILSFTFFTLFLSSIVKATHIPAESLRLIAIVVLTLFGVTLLIPKFQVWMETLFSKLSSLVKPQTPNTETQDGFLSGIPVGASLGLLWTPCVGPIIASVITLAATSEVSGSAILITLAYSIGTAIPMLAIIQGGRQLLTKNQWLLKKASAIQKTFGIIMILTAIGIFFNIDRKFQSYILTTFPNYGTGLTALEDNTVVQQALRTFRNPLSQNTDMQGKPMDEVQQQANGTGSKLPVLGKAPGFSMKDGEWINSDPLTLESLRGKVVLVDFWTYTCINCIRTLPYIKSWYEKYAEKGLVIIGVHTPEFEFEKSVSNVQKAVADFGLLYPIVQDNSYGIWRAYDNHYWPAKYLIDKDGNIRNTHFGEGDYDETEEYIQELLRETGAEVTEKPNNPEYTIEAKTPETYLGYDRIEFLSSPEPLRKDNSSIYSIPTPLSLNRFAYGGNWNIGAERAMPESNSSLQLHFLAKDVFLVMRPKEEEKPGIVRVLFNGKPLTTNQAGNDIMNGIITVNTDRLYHLLSFPNAQSGIITLEFPGNTVELYAFTFG